MFTQASAASVAASRTAEPPVSVRRNSRSGVWRLRAHAVRPENSEAAAGPTRRSVISILSTYVFGRRSAGRKPDAQGDGAGELPLLRLDPRRRAGRKHWEVLGQVLTGRQLHIRRRPPTVKAWRDDPHHRLLSTRL